MRPQSSIITLALLIPIAGFVFGQEGESKKITRQTDASPSFKEDVFPVIKKRCLPCHAQEENNPSDLALDSFELMAKGGKHGTLLVAGKSAESMLIRKLDEKPPFGDRMPLNSKRKIREGKAVWLTDDEVITITKWIDQGAKNN